MKTLERYIGILMLLFAVGFNLWIYRLEPTAKVDPNDNTFQYALVDRTNQIWDFAQQTCTGITKPMCALSYLTDHWVPNWAEGYNLPYYYSHIPQIVIVASYRLFSTVNHTLSLFSYYHEVIYLLLSLFPFSLYLALLVIDSSPIVAGLGALAATQLSTDGLYGLDPSSFLWRGYGLSSQLFAMIFLPLAIAYAYRYFVNTELRIMNTEKNHNSVFSIQYSLALPAVLALAATTAGHLGIGIIAFISVGVLAISPTIQAIVSKQFNKETLPQLWQNLVRLAIIFGGVGLLLGYWILPILKDGNYHNISVWDPIWKFDSYGYREVLKNLLNGNLFDFGRFPLLTLLTILGFFSAVSGKIFADRFPSSKSMGQTYTDNRQDTILAARLASSGARKLSHEQQRSYFPFALLFLFWLLLYFGRTTWGNLIDLIPGMTEFHISRFIVGVHMAGFFLIPLGMKWLAAQTSRITKLPQIAVILLGTIGFGIILVPQTLSYAFHNEFLVKRANNNYLAVKSDDELLLSTLRRVLTANPGRVLAGRGGSWGKSFRIAETPYYIYLSTQGVPVVLWLPETWSPNSDTEQYFSENRLADYALYNIRYVVTPLTLAKEQIQPFWKLLTAGKTWKLYEVTDGSSVIPSTVEGTFGYINSGVRPAIVSVTKTTYLNVVHLWIQSDFPKAGLYPELTFDKNYPKNTGLPNFRMLTEVLYKIPARNASHSDAGGPDGSIHDLFAANPVYVSPQGDAPHMPKVLSQSDDHDMIFKASVDVPQGCTECVLILKQSFHPSWQATVDGKVAPTFAVFPFFTAVKLDTAGTHDIVIAYRPSTLKVVLLILSLISLGYFLWLYCHNALNKIKAKL